MLKSRIILLLTIQSFNIHAQDWESIGAHPTGINYSVRVLYSDSITDKLYVGGNFSMIDSLTANLIASWDGSNFDTLSQGFLHGSNVLSIINYNDTIIAGGGIRPDSCLFKWNNSNWDLFYPKVNSSIDVMKKINGELYVGGTFDSVGSSYTTKIAKWNGINWESIILSGLDVPNSQGIFAIEYYNGNYYFGGILNETGSWNLVRWDGLNTFGVGGGVNGGLAFVSSLVVYHGELYVGGYFTVADGNVGNHIMKWDGTNWSDVGGGLDYWVNDMKVYNDQLYVAGVFEHAGGIAASKIARWDGTNWYALGADVFDNNLTTLEFYHNELYVGGGFHNVGSVPANFIAKYTGQLPSGINETENNFSFSLYPNPSENLLHISFSGLLKTEISLEIFNSLGEKITTQKLLQGTKQTAIDISGFAKGVYTCRLLSDKEFAVRKFLKE